MNYWTQFLKLQLESSQSCFTELLVISDFLRLQCSDQRLQITPRCKVICGPGASTCCTACSSLWHNCSGVWKFTVWSLNDQIIRNLSSALCSIEIALLHIASNFAFDENILAVSWCILRWSWLIMQYHAYLSGTCKKPCKTVMGSLIWQRFLGEPQISQISRARPCCFEQSTFNSMYYVHCQIRIHSVHIVLHDRFTCISQYCNQIWNDHIDISVILLFNIKIIIKLFVS